MIIAELKDKAVVVDILVSAFRGLKEGNSINFIVKQDDKRIERMRVLMGYLFENAMAFGKVYLSNNRKSCLLLKYPYKEKNTIKTVLWKIQLVYKCIGIERTFEILKRQRIVKRYMPSEKYIRPLITGVKKEYRGGVTAARLMIDVIDEHKNNTLPVIVDTVSDYNLKLYQKFGFDIFGKDETLGFPIYFLRIN